MFRDGNLVSNTAISAEAITRRYDRILALEHASIAIEHGEVHALIGENGAGKSTVVRILAGIERPDAGVVLGDCSRVAVVPQTPRLAPSLPVWQNLVVGLEPRIGPILDRRRAVAFVEEVATQFSIDLDIHVPARRLNQTEQRLAALLGALVRDPEVVLLDEPTVGLAPIDRERIHTAVGALRDRGKGILYISHDIREVTEIADRVTVLVAGRTTVTRERPFSGDQLATDIFPVEPVDLDAAPPSAAIRSVSKPRERIAAFEELMVQDPRGGRTLGPLSLALNAGEILAITGVRESGLDLLERFLTGEVELSAGALRVGGKRLSARLDPGELRRRRIAFVPSDRIVRAAALEGTVTENAIVADRTRIHPRGIRAREDERTLTGRLLSRFGIRESRHLPLGALSGGTIQKLILARELDTDPELCIIAEPSAGLDIRSIERLYRDLRTIADHGAAILLLSSHVDSVLPVADSIVALYDGKIGGRYAPGEKTEITRAITGLAGVEVP